MTEYLIPKSASVELYLSTCLRAWRQSDTGIRLEPLVSPTWQGFVLANTLNVRVTPGMGDNIIGQVRYGDVVNILNYENEFWYRIKWKDALGYVAKSWILDLSAFAWQAWPTPYVYYPAHRTTLAVNQGFGANPELYAKYNLPGHEGLDLYAELDDPIYAVADGVVYRAEDNANSGNYGRHVRMEHANGYKTLYAHLNRVAVGVGSQIEAGDVIGLADSTGNSTGHHLHLTLKLQDATKNGLTTYPYDIIDPTPYMMAWVKLNKPES